MASSSAAIRAAAHAAAGLDLSALHARLDKYVTNDVTSWQFDGFEPPVGDAAAAIIAGALEASGCVTTLFLNDNEIGDLGAAALAKALETNTSCTRVFLAHNAIDDHGAQALASGLESNATLQVLSLSSNKVGDLGCAALCRSLGLTAEEEAQEIQTRNGRKPKQNSTLLGLYINDNRITDVGAKAIASSIVGHVRVGGKYEALTYNRNAITAEGEKAIAAARHSIDGTDKKKGRSTRTIKRQSGDQDPSGAD